MTDRDVREVAAEIVAMPELRGVRLDLEAVTIALTEAKRDYDWEAVTKYETQIPSAELSSRLEGFRKRVRVIYEEWHQLPIGDRVLVARLVADDALDEIGSRLLFIVDLLDEFDEHFGREPGSPGFIREDPTVHVSPIEQFVLVLFKFWTNTTGRPFGHGTKEPQFAGTVVATKKGEKAKRRKEVDAKPNAPAMHFLYAAQEVLAREYDAATLSGIVRKIKEEIKRDLLATDGSIQS